MGSRLRITAVFLALLAAYFLFVYRNYFGLGAISQGDLSPLYPRAGYYFDAFFSSWNSNNLGFSGSATEAGFFNALLLLITGDNSILAQKIVFLSDMPVACIAMFVFLSYHGASGFGRSIISFAYGVNPLSIGLFFGGGGGLLTYYSLFPLILLFLLNFLEKGTAAKRSMVAFAIVLAFSASFDVQSPLFLLPFVVILFVSNAALERNLRSLAKTSLMLLGSFGLFLILILPTAATYFSSFFSYYFGSKSGSVSYYSVAPIAHNVLIDRITTDFSFQTFDFLSVAMYLTGIVAAFALFVRNRHRLRYILSLLLLLSVGIIFWQFGLTGQSLWLYETFPPLFALNTLKLKMIFTQAYVLIVAFLVDEARERRLIGLTGRAAPK
jgi:hypothetical protein